MLTTIFIRNFGESRIKCIQSNQICHSHQTPRYYSRVMKSQSAELPVGIGPPQSKLRLPLILWNCRQNPCYMLQILNKTIHNYIRNFFKTCGGTMAKVEKSWRTNPVAAFFFLGPSSSCILQSCINLHQHKSKLLPVQ